MRKVLRQLALALVLVIVSSWGTSAWADPEPTDKQISDEIKKLATTLSGKADAKVLWRGELISLLEQIEKTLGTRESADFVANRAKHLTALLAPAHTDGTSAPLQPVLLTLYRTTADKLYPASAEDLRARLQGLLTWLKDNWKDPRPIETQTVREDALKLSQALEDVADDPLEAQADDLAKRLTAVLGGKSPKDFKSAYPSLKLLKAAIDVTLQASRPQIYVLGAEYGDFRKSAYRTCSATDYVRSACHGQKRCTLQGLSNTAACGYDPVPFVEAKYRIVSVAYACISGRLDVWEDKIMVKRNERRPRRLLRSAADMIVCSE